MNDLDFKELSAVSELNPREHFGDLAMSYSGRKFIILSNDKPIVLGGLAEWYKGVGNVWMWSTNDFQEVAIEATKLCKSVIDDFLRDGHRVQCESMATHSNIHKWLESIGLSHEHTKRCCGKNREDFFIYSKVV